MPDETDPDKQEPRVPAVGYRRPPVHSRFKPGQSGNPKGRAKGSKNFKTLFDQILNEEVSVREGSEVRKISKAEAILRGVVVGALKGDLRCVATLFRVAEQTGQFEQAADKITEIRQVIVSWKSDDPSNPSQIPAGSGVYREEDS